MEIGDIIMAENPWDVFSDEEIIKRIQDKIGSDTLENDHYNVL